MSNGIIFFEGWEGDQTASVWENVPLNPPFMTNPTIQAQFARTGGYGLGFHGLGTPAAQGPILPNTDNWIVGFAFRWNPPISGGVGIGNPIAALKGPGDVTHIAIGITSQTTLALDVGGTLYFSTRTLDENAWYYIEFASQLHATNGFLKIHLNGGEIFNVAGVQTVNPGLQASQKFFNQLFLGRLSGFLAEGFNFDFDDIYIKDANVDNTFLGDVEVLNFALEADEVVQFQRSGGAANYEMVDESVPDEDATYVFTDVSGHQDFYQVGDTSFGGIIHGVQLVTRARKTATQLWTIESAIKLGATTTYGLARFLAYPDYETLQPDVWGDAPGKTGWTVQDFNDMVVGFRVVSP